MIRYAESGHTLLLRFIDEVRYTQCGPLSKLLDQRFDEGNIDNVLIDLTEASSIDSTCLGLLAQINNYIDSHYHHKTPIFTTNPDIDRTLDTVGFDAIFTLLHQTPNTIVESSEIPDSTLSDRETAEIILGAHRCLAELNEENWREFGGVVSGLEAELGRK